MKQRFNERVPVLYTLVQQDVSDMTQIPASEEEERRINTTNVPVKTGGRKRKRWVQESKHACKQSKIWKKKVNYTLKSCNNSLSSNRGVRGETAAGARLVCRVSGHGWRWLTTAQCSVDSDTELLVRANEPWSATVISLCISVGKSGSVLALRPSLEAHFCLSQSCWCAVWGGVLVAALRWVCVAVCGSSST